MAGPDPYAGLGTPITAPGTTPPQADPYAGLGSPIAQPKDPYEGLGTPIQASRTPIFATQGALAHESRSMPTRSTVEPDNLRSSTDDDTGTAVVPLNELRARLPYLADQYGSGYSKDQIAARNFFDDAIMHPGRIKPGDSIDIPTEGKKTINVKYVGNQKFTSGDQAGFEVDDVNKLPKFSMIGTAIRSMANGAPGQFGGVAGIGLMKPASDKLNAVADELTAFSAETGNPQAKMAAGLVRAAGNVLPLAGAFLGGASAQTGWEHLHPQSEADKTALSEATAEHPIAGAAGRLGSGLVAWSPGNLARNEMGKIDLAATIGERLPAGAVGAGAQAGQELMAGSQPGSLGRVAEAGAANMLLGGKPNFAGRPFENVGEAVGSIPGAITTAIRPSTIVDRVSVASAHTNPAQANESANRDIQGIEPIGEQAGAPSAIGGPEMGEQPKVPAPTNVPIAKPTEGASKLQQSIEQSLGLGTERTPAEVQDHKSQIEQAIKTAEEVSAQLERTKAGDTGVRPGDKGVFGSNRESAEVPANPTQTAEPQKPSVQAASTKLAGILEGEAATPMGGREAPGQGPTLSELKGQQATWTSKTGQKVTGTVIQNDDGSWGIMPLTRPARITRQGSRHRGRNQEWGQSGNRDRRNPSCS